MTAFSEVLRQRREQLGLTVAVAAARAGVEGPNYRAWEAGRRVPPEERQAVILAALAMDTGKGAGDYRDGALWALAAMHETLGRLYRELAARSSPVIPPEDLAALRELTSGDAPPVATPVPRRRRKAG